MTKWKKNIVFFVFIISTTLILQGKFLVDDDFNSANDAKNTENTNDNASDTYAYPKNIAKNIQVLPVPGERDSLKITWNTSTGSDDTFIVGRTNVIPSTESAALSAISIKVILPGEGKEVVDKNIPEGKYYYVVLSKKKIASKQIELYPNENYITNPLTISNTADEISLLPQITNLKASIIKQGSVVLSWTPLKAKDVVYTIYRSEKPLNSSDRVKTAERIISLSDADAFKDISHENSGEYFYAVTTSDSIRIEDTTLKADQSFTTVPVSVIIEKTGAVSKITAVTTDENEVKIEWTGIPDFQGEYLVYRNDVIIDKKDKLSKSFLVNRVPALSNSYVDNSVVPGTYFYAVIAKTENGVIRNEFIEGENYITSPIEIGKPIRLRLMDSKMISNKKVEIKWQYTGDVGNKNYGLYRSSEIIESIGDIEKLYLIENIRISSSNYIDLLAAEGNYYYYLIPTDYKTDSNFSFQKGVNFTYKPISVEDEKVDNYKLRLLDVKSNKDSAVLSWKYSGNAGENLYFLYRTEKNPGNVKSYKTYYLLDKVNIEDEKYTDYNIPNGKYYYILVPSNYKSIENFNSQKGINYNSNVIVISRQNSVSDNKGSVIDNKNKLDITEPSFDEYISKGVDAILKDYFYKNKYDDTIMLLKNYAGSVSNAKDRAYAGYYIGRSYAAKGQYKTALKYFLNDSISGYFEKDCAFWRDYCIKRMKR